MLTVQLSRSEVEGIIFNLVSLAEDVAKLYEEREQYRNGSYSYFEEYSKLYRTQYNNLRYVIVGVMLGLGAAWETVRLDTRIRDNSTLQNAINEAPFQILHNGNNQGDGGELENDEEPF